MIIKAKLAESEKTVRNMILGELSKQISHAIDKSIPQINTAVQKIVAEALRKQPEYHSLKSGALKYELGIDDPTSIDRLIQTLTETGRIEKTKIKITNHGLSGGFVYRMLGKQDLEEILLSSNAKVIDFKRQYSLPWLEWMLYRGTSVIVKNYEVVFSPNEASRTGGALMKESDKSWRVPPEYAGTLTNNWITRAVSICEKQVLSVIQSTIKSNI